MTDSSCDLCFLFLGHWFSNVSSTEMTRRAFLSTIFWAPLLKSLIICISNKFPNGISEAPILRNADTVLPCVPIPVVPVALGKMKCEIATNLQLACTVPISKRARRPQCCFSCTESVSVIASQFLVFPQCFRGGSCFELRSLLFPVAG